MSTDNTPKPAPTLATGAALTPDTWADFVTRLRHHHCGEGVEWHSTANALFLVEAKRYVYGISDEYCDISNTVVINDGSIWTSAQAYWHDCDEDEQRGLNEDARREHEKDFLALDGYDQLQLLGKLQNHTVTGRHEQWEYVGAHLTREAADAFIRRKGNDYRDGLRVYVESRQYAWEFTAVIDAIIDGKLVLAP